MASNANGRTRTHARKPNNKEKLNGRKIPITLLYRSVLREIPFGIDKTYASHAQRNRESKWDLRLHGG